MGQRFSFGLADTALAESGGVSLYDLHTNVDAICKAYEAIEPVVERLAIDPLTPRLAGLAYVHISTIGCEVTFSADSVEPWTRPCIKCPEDIDALTEPDDYMSAGIVPRRLALADQLRQRRPDANLHIGHDYEGPVTTAALMMGMDFFTLPLDDPARAHRLLTFTTNSALNYAKAIRAHQGRPVTGGRQGMVDDFAGMFGPDLFAEFVAPYWRRIYEGFEAETRGVHSELLRREHLHFLRELSIDEYDPSVNQYLTPETLCEACPVPYTLRLWPAEVRDHSADELVEMYKYRAGFNPVFMSFGLSYLCEEEKIAALLDVARQLA